MKPHRATLSHRTGFLARLAWWGLAGALALAVQTGWTAESNPGATLTNDDVPILKEKKPEVRPLPFALPPNFNAAEQGDAAAQYNLGLCYEEGKGVATNYVTAVQWFRKAAERGHPGAQCQLGFCYFMGEGVPENTVEAIQWYRKSAEQRYPPAQFNLAGCYASGKGVDKDAPQAVAWYRRAADQGFAKAQYNLGVCLESGFGVTQDPFEAVKWYRKAAEQGLASAQRNLGLCYEKGLGVERDVVEAYKWLSQAAAQGNAGAKQSRAALERKMTLEQIAEAQRLPDSLSQVPPSEPPPAAGSSGGLEISLEAPETTFRTTGGIAFVVCFQNNTSTNLLLNGGAMLGNGVQIWNNLEAELKSETGQRIPMSLSMGIPMTGRVYFLGVPLRSGSHYRLLVGARDNLAGSNGVLNPGKYELRCLYHGRQSPYRDSTQLPPCWEGEVQSSTLHIKVLRAQISGVSDFFAQMWDAIR